MKIRSILLKINWKISIVSLITIMGVYHRLQVFAKRGLWNDELYQIEMSKGAFKPFWTHQIYGDHTHFPGEYLLTYPFVQLYTDDKWILALPHIPFMLLSFFLFYKISNLYFKSLVGFIVGFTLLRYNMDLVFHSLEFRPYAVLPTLSLACFYFSHIIVYQYTQLSRLKKWLIALFFVATINFHAYGVLIGLLPLVFHMLQKERWGLERILKSDYIAYVIRFMFFAMLIWCWYAMGSSFGMHPNKVQAIRPTFQFTIDPRVNFIGFIDRFFGNLVGYPKLNLFVCCSLPIFLILNRKRLQQLLLLLILIIIPFTLIVLVDMKSQYWLLKRQYIWVMPFFALLIGWIYDQGYIIAKEYGQKLYTKLESSNVEK